jgi:hypothetical protein
MTVSVWPSAPRLLVIGCMAILTCAKLSFADSYTQTDLYVGVLGNCAASGTLLPPPHPFIPGCRRGDTGSTRSSAWLSDDSSTTSWLGVSRADTATTYGTNQTSIDLNQKQTFQYTSTAPHLALTYSLDVLSPDGTWQSLINTSRDHTGVEIWDPLNTVLTTHMALSWDVPYQIRSSLKVAGENANTKAISLSEWADVLIFSREHGQAEPGPNAIAELMVSINGFLFAEENFLPGTCVPGQSNCVIAGIGPTWERKAIADFNATFGVDVPQYVRIETESGTRYPTSVPELTTSLTLLSVGLISLSLVGRQARLTFSKGRKGRATSVNCHRHER